MNNFKEEILEQLYDIEVRVKDLQEMINEPVSKEWFEKYNLKNMYPDGFISESEQIISEDLKN